MLTTTASRTLIALTIGFAFVISGCEEVDERGSLFPDAPVSQSPPAVSTISPATGLAGVTVLTLTGSNFSATMGNNIVYFDNIPAAITQASATQLTVKAPNLVKDSINVRVAVIGNERLSTTYYYTLLPAIEEYGGFGATDEPWSIEVDNNDNVFVSLSISGVGVGIKRIAPDGSVTDYSPGGGGIVKWTAMKFGPGGELFTARLIPAIYSVPPGGGTATIWLSRGGLGSVYDLDFDPQGNIWAAGNNTAVYRVRSDKSVTSFPFTMNVRAIRVNGGYLYVGGLKDTTESVWRFPFVSADSIGAAEKVFDMRTDFGSSTARVNALAFASDGDMFIATNASVGIIVVTPSGSFSALYPGLLSENFVHLGQTSSNILYASRETGTSGLDHTLFRINTQEK